MSFKGETKERINHLRARTLVLTSCLTVGIIFYCLMQWIITGEVDVINLIIVGAIQIMTHFAYYDDGSNFGETDINFIENKKAYNDKADEINEKHKFDNLRDYCKHQYMQNKERYIERKLGFIGINQQEFEYLKQKSQKEIKSLKYYEFNGKIVFFTRSRKKELYKLIFKPIPVEENQPEYIMSAVDYDFTKAIKDKSVAYTTVIHIKRILKSTIIAIFVAYIGFTFKNFDWTNIVEMVFYLVTLVTTAVFSYSAGEKNTRKYKSQFYLQLSQFLDGFNEWNLKNDQ